MPIIYSNVYSEQEKAMVKVKLIEENTENTSVTASHRCIIGNTV